MRAVRQLLEMVPTTDVAELASVLVKDGDYNIIADNYIEIVVTARIDTKTVRLMQGKDLNVDDTKSYGATKRGSLSAAETKEYTPDPPMTVETEWNELKTRKESIRLNREELETAGLDDESVMKNRGQLRKDEKKYNNHCAKFFLKL